MGDGGELLDRRWLHGRLSPGRGLSRLFEFPRAAAAGGAFTIAFSSILVDLSGATPATAAIFRCLYALPALALLARRDAPAAGALSPRHLRNLYLAGVCLGADLIFWHHAIRDVGAGLATMIANVQVLVLPFVAWLLWSERPSRKVLIAVPVATLGIVLVSGILGRAYGADPVRGVLFGLLAGGAYVGFLLLMRSNSGSRDVPAGALFHATLASTLFCLVVGLALGEADLVPTWPSAGWLILLALSSQVLGWLLITASMPRLPTATTSLILISQPACTVVFAAVILAQVPSPEQLLGVVLILSCLAAITGRSTGAVPRGRRGAGAAGTAIRRGVLSRRRSPCRGRSGWTARWRRS